MKLIRFIVADTGRPHFGVVVQDQAVPFTVLQGKAGTSHPGLADSRAYLTGLPDSEQAAKELLAWGERHIGELDNAERPCHVAEQGTQRGCGR